MKRTAFLAGGGAAVAPVRGWTHLCPMTITDVATGESIEIAQPVR